MNTHERFSRIYAHQPADRIPIWDSPWTDTIARWRREGMPTEDYVDYFDLDKIAHIHGDNSPRYPYRVIEETEEYLIYISQWGATLKQWKNVTSTPDFLDFTIKDRASWEEAKARMTPSLDRVDWQALQANYPKWRKEGHWIVGNLWFGFDVAHSWAVGTERLLIALLEDPEWCFDMFNHYLDVHLALMDAIWDKGYHFDEVYWPDDMGYKGAQFFSPKIYRELIKPVHKRAIDWAHAKGIYAHLHSCGDIRPFVPELLDIGLDALNPLEVKAGVDPVVLKEQVGDKLVLHGGINAVLWDQEEAIIEAIEQVVPKLKEQGGYVFASDHSIPNAVSLEQFTRIVSTVKRVGAYD